MFESFNAFLESDLALALCALFGVVLGSFLTFFTTRYFEKKRLLVDFYAEFLTAYSRCVPKAESLDDLRLLTVSVEKMRLVCPKKARKPLTMIHAAALNNFWDPEIVRPAYEDLWNIMQKKLRL